jgi:hypothetical protein
VQFDEINSFFNGEAFERLKYIDAMTLLTFVALVRRSVVGDMVRSSPLPAGLSLWLLLLI